VLAREHTGTPIQWDAGRISPSGSRPASLGELAASPGRLVASLGGLPGVMAGRSESFGVDPASLGGLAVASSLGGRDPAGAPATAASLPSAMTAAEDRELGGIHVGCGVTSAIKGWESNGAALYCTAKT